jgi:hypothetical protein
MPLFLDIKQAIYDGLNGARGLAGWQCDVYVEPVSKHVSEYFSGLFIVDGIITVPIGLLGYFLMPSNASDFQSC